MDKNQPRPAPSSISQQSPQTQAPRDVSIQQYVQAARERLEAINASLPPSNNNSTTSIPQSLPQQEDPTRQEDIPRQGDVSRQEATLPPQTVAEYAKNPSSSTQWPLKAPAQEQAAPGPKSHPESQVKTEPTRQVNPYSKSSQIPTSTQRSGRTTPRSEAASKPNTTPYHAPTGSRGAPASRGYKGAATRHPPGQNRTTPPTARRPYYPPPNVAPPQAFKPPTATKPPLNVVPPASNRPKPAQVPVAKPFAPRSAEADIRSSANSSIMNAGTLDILSEYSDDEAASETGNNNPVLTNANPPASPSVPPSSSGTGIVRQASVGHVQKPVMTNIPANARGDGVSVAGDLDATDTEEMFPVSPLTEPSKKSMDLSNLDLLPPPAANPSVPQVPAGVHPIPKSQLLVSPAPVHIASSPNLVSPTPVAQPSSSPNPKRSRSPLLALGSKFTGGRISPKPDRAKDGSRDPFAQQQDKQSPREVIDSGFASPTQMPPSVGSAGGIRDSTTSLRGLIVRNLRLASNLERGKTSSKFGMEWMLNNTDNGGGAKRESAGSMSAMINTFPTASKEEKSRSMTEDDFEFPGSKFDGQSPLTSDGKDTTLDDGERNGQPRRRRRQCCWMPLWLFVLLIIAIILLIAAAIIVPVALIVIPDQNHSGPTPTPSPTGASSECSRSLQCENGGLAQMNASGTCYCICVNSFTGPTCSARDSSCGSIKTADAPNVAIGSHIPYIVARSHRAFNIDLDTSALLEAFGSSNMSCSAQNDLVSFNGVASGTLPGSRPAPRRVPTLVKVARPTRVAPRQDTTNGIIYATQSTPVMSTPTTPTNTPSSTETPVSSWGSSSQAVEFARTGTLYILQFTSKLDVAQTAHSRFQNYLQSSLADGSVYSGNHVVLGNGWRADFTSWTVYFHSM